MKALQMLDHVMLWVARGFAIIFVIWGCLVFSMELCIPAGYPGRSIAWGILMIALAVAWLISLWNQGNFIARLFLCITGAFNFVGTGILFLECVNDWRKFGNLSTDFASQVIISFLMLTGIASIIWVSFRPYSPRNLNSVSAHPMAPNPVNIVNSV